MRPKATVATVQSDATIRQALETMNFYHCGSAPIIDKQGYYMGTLTEGDLLWYIVRGEGGEDCQVDIERLENVNISVLGIKPDSNSTVSISANMEELIMKSVDHDFIPVVDDRGFFIGVVKQSDLVKHFYNSNFEVDDMIDDSK